MKTLKTLASGALLLAAAGVSAQDVPDTLDPAHMDTEASPAEGTMPAQDAAPAETDTMTDTAEPAVKANFSDEEIAAFVGATVAIRGMGDNETLADDARQSQAEAILTEHGIDPETYNAIGVAAQSDPIVAQRVQLAISAMNENGDT